MEELPVVLTRGVEVTVAPGSPSLLTVLVVIFSVAGLDRIVFCDDVGWDAKMFSSCQVIPKHFLSKVHFYSAFASQN